jgi:hypothetical protein
MAQVYHPYSSAVPFFQDAAEPGIAPEEQNRLRSYDVYEQMYYNHPDTFKLLQRGDDEAPIYLPSAKQIVEATSRFLALGFDFLVESTAGGTTNDQDMLKDTLKNLFKRERFYLKFNSQRRFGLIRGDAVWHITANDTKPELTRISIHAVPAKRYFPIFEDDDPESVIGCHLVDTVKDPKDDTKRVIRRQTYRKEVDGAGLPTGKITSECALFTIGKWDDRHLKPNEIEQVAVVTPVTQLHPLITSIPVYHIPNDWNAGIYYGSSLVRGIETILAAVNQSVSDEALAMAISGLGSYWTNASPPVDPSTGLPTAWEIGPLRMTEVPMDRTVGRLEGVGSVQPSLDHRGSLLDAAMRGASVPDIAAGKVDVAIAESGISLRLQLAPILAANAEREQNMIATYDQMFYDLTRMWLPAYESITTDATVTAVVDDPLPTNRAEQIKEITDLVTAKILSVEEGRQELIKIGYEIDPSSAGLIAEQSAIADATDTFAKRAAQELNTDPNAAPQEAPVGTPV